MPIDRSNVRGLVRAIAYDLKGARLGRVAQVFLDDRSDEPAWVAVDVTRVRGMRLLPLAGAALKGRHLVIRAERTTVRSAPRIDLGDGQLTSQDESRLLEHYGLAPQGQHPAPTTAEQRPVSPWSDDTERETAWERPAEPDPVPPPTAPMAAQPADPPPPPPADPPPAPPADPPADPPPPAPATPTAPAFVPAAQGQRPTTDSGIGDRGSMRTREPEPSQAPAAAPMRQSDTEPTVTSAPPTQPKTEAIQAQPGPPPTVPETRPDADGSAR